ncbi:MAG: hypothetical protein GY722_14450 [bacterium]|nr:hypothetical protein [bacterium]
MRKFLVLVIVFSTLLVGAPALAGNQEVDYSKDLPGPAEGVALDRAGNIYVSIGVFPTGPEDPGSVQVWKVDRRGNGSMLAEIPYGPGAAGVAVRGRNVYVGVQAAGVFRINRQGDWNLVPGTNAIAFPNAMAFDWRGNMYITETYSFAEPLVDYPGCVGSFLSPEGKFGQGGLWVVPRRGEAELIVRHDLLTAPVTPGSCAFVPFPVGANGIAFDWGRLVIASSERSLILEAPVSWRGSVGDIEVLTDLSGNMGPMGPWAPDGVDVDWSGDVYAALVNAASVVKISENGSQVDVVGTMDDGLTAPASVVVQDRWRRGDRLFVSNLFFGIPGPPLVRIDL